MRQGRREEGKEGEQCRGWMRGISTLQSRKELKLEGQSDGGYGGEVKDPRGEKKKFTEGRAPWRLHWRGRRFQSAILPCQTLVLPGGSKSGVCEVGMEASIGEKGFNFD